MATFADNLPAARHWFLNTSRGGFLLEREKELLSGTVARLFGHHTCTLGVMPDLALLEDSKVLHKTFLTPLAEKPIPETVRVDPNHWGIQPRSMDAVLLHHALEFSENPHRVLREACRAIRPGGRLLVVGFNPLSLWNPVRMTGCGEMRILRQSRMYHAQRISDWLRLLNFRTCEVKYGGALFPVTYSLPELYRHKVDRFVEQINLFHIGAFYVLVATKERSGLIPYDRRWRNTRSRLMGASAGPAACRNRESQGTFKIS